MQLMQPPFVARKLSLRSSGNRKKNREEGIVVKKG